MRQKLVLLAVLAALVGAVTATSAYPRPSLAERQLAFETQIVRELNDVRAGRGLAKLRWEPGLRTAAANHSRAMAVRGFFAHESRDGRPFHVRIRKHYPSDGWQRWAVGETLLSHSGQIDARSVVAAWLASPAHRDILLAPRWRDVGVGAFATSGGAVSADLDAATVVVTVDVGVRTRR